MSLYNRDEEEQKLLMPILDKYFEEWNNPLKEFLTINSKKVLYLPEQYHKEIERLCIGKDILEKYGSKLPENLFLELIRRGGVIMNNDAMYTQNTNNTVVKKECEGFSIHNDVYKLLNKYPQLFVKESFYLTNKQIEEIRNNISEKFSKVYKHDLSPENINDNNDILIPSGDEIHMKIVTEYTTLAHEKKNLSYAAFTSTVDSGTIKIFNKQPFNLDISEQNKAQNVRFQLVHFKNDRNISEYKEATQFINNENYEGHNINGKILEGFNIFEQEIKNIPARQAYTFNRTFLEKVSIIMFDEKINKLKKDFNKIEMDLKNLDEQKRKEKLDEYKRQEKNQLKKEKEAAILKTSYDNDIKKIIINKNKLEEEKRKFSKKNNEEKSKIYMKNGKK